MGKHKILKKKYLRRFGSLHDVKSKNMIAKRKTEFGKRFEEKQKIKFLYGISEKQFSRYVDESLKSHRDPAIDLCRRLELRLDSSVYHLGFAKTREQARQLIIHGHVLVNNQKVDIPSYHLEPRDTISLKKEILENILVKEAISLKRPADLPTWLERENARGTIKHLPKKEEIRRDLEFDMVIEFYS